MSTSGGLLVENTGTLAAAMYIKIKSEKVDLQKRGLLVARSAA